MADDPTLVVSGQRYSGWKSIRVSLSMESIAGSFAVDVSDRWDGAKAPWPVFEESACKVQLGDDVVIDGYIDKRALSASKDSRTLTYSGRDRAAALVDCSALVKAGSVSKGKWTFTNENLVGLAKKICEPFGIAVSVQPGLEAALIKTASKKVLHPGDTGFEVLAKEAAAVGAMLVSDGAGGLLITRASAERAESLVEGENILAASVEYDATERFYRYLLSSQVPGTDEQFGDDCRIQAEAIDQGVARTERVLLIRPDKGYNTADAKRRADWEARIRAARCEKLNVTVQGWRQSNGLLWQINRVTKVRAPTLLGVNGDLRISTVEFSTGEGGTITQLGLVRPDAFTPEPTAVVKESSGLWKELAKGAL